MISRLPISSASGALAVALLWASPGHAQPGPPAPPPAAPIGDPEPAEKPVLLGAKPEETDDYDGRPSEVHDPFEEAPLDETYEEQPISETPTHVAADPPDARHRHLPAAGKRSIEAYSLMFFGQAVMASLDEYGLKSAVGMDDPAPLEDKNLRLDGDGALLGAGFRATIQHDEGWRIGLGSSFAALDGMKLLHEPLQNGVRVALGNVLAVSVETSFGKAFNLAPVYPYLDLRTVVHVVSAQIGLETDAYGFVGATPYNVLSFTLAPRVGVFVPIDDVFFVDVSGQYGMFGIERAGLFAGFGVWTGDAEH